MPGYRARFPDRKTQTNDALATVVRSVIPTHETLVGVVLDTHRWNSCRALVQVTTQTPRLVVPNPASGRREWQRPTPPPGSKAVACDLAAFLRTDRTWRGKCNVAYFDYCGLYGPSVRADIRTYFRTHARPGAPGVFAVTCCTRGAGHTQRTVVRGLVLTVARAALDGAGLRCKVRARNLYQHVSLVFELSRVQRKTVHGTSFIPSTVGPKVARKACANPRWTRAPRSAGLPAGWWIRQNTNPRVSNHTYASPDLGRVFGSLAVAHASLL